MEAYMTKGVARHNDQRMSANVRYYQPPFEAPEYEEKVIDGVVHYRTKAGAGWYELPHKVDRLLGYLRLRLNLPTNTALIDLAGLHEATISRIRNGHIENIPAAWYVHLYDVSGVSIEQMREITKEDPVAQRYIPPRLAQAA
jgi:hypothetical protein